MRWLTAPFVWAYDFLAEDVVLLVGTALAIAVAVLAVRVAPNAAGIILWAVVILVIATSLWRGTRARTS